MKPALTLFGPSSDQQQPPVALSLPPPTPSIVRMASGSITVRTNTHLQIKQATDQAKWHLRSATGRDPNEQGLEEAARTSHQDGHLHLRGPGGRPEDELDSLSASDGQMED